MSKMKIPKIIVSFSGGKDSTWMLLEMIRRKEHIDEVVFFDTGWEFPQMLRHIEKIKKLVEDKGITFTTLHPEKTFDYLMFEYDIPTRDGSKKIGKSWCGGKCRWGTYEKIKTIKNYFRNESNYVECIGIAADETERLKKNAKAIRDFRLRNGV